MPGAYYELKGDALAAFQLATKMIKDKARVSLGTDFEVRDLRPQDLTLSNPDFTYSITSGAAYNTMINNGTIDSNRWIAIYGVRYAQATPLISQLKITTGGALKMDRNIQYIPSTQDKTLYFDPILIEQNQNLLVEGYNNTASTTNTAEKLVFIGVVAEKKGKVLAPTC